jgi:hypothetical protein
MDVDLLPAESVRAGTQRVACALRIVDTLQSEHVDVELVRGLPVVNVDDHVVEVADAHVPSPLAIPACPNRRMNEAGAPVR